VLRLVRDDTALCDPLTERPSLLGVRGTVHIYVPPCHSCGR
jgi:hypothetical protein